MEHSFFEAVLPQVSFNYTGDTQVCCPFPHKSNGVEYYETNPSAGINLSKKVFHCFSCDRAFSEITFAAEYLKTSIDNAAKIVHLVHNAEDISNWKLAVNNLWKTNEAMKTVFKLGFSKSVAQELQLGYKTTGIIFPIIMFGRLLDEVTYNPGQEPKYMRRPNSTSGLIYGYDVWKATPKHRNTIICAGEKDMTIARTKGFNAVSFTGGEQTIPHLFLNEFRDRNVYIIYDNDETGRDGASKLAMYLQPIANNVCVVDLSSTCINKGEDLWDFFQRYNKTADDLLEILRATPQFTEEDQKKEKDKYFPIVSLHEATTGKFIGKTLRSNVQVVATIDNTFLLPILITSNKYKSSEKPDANMLPLNSKNTWSLNEWNLKEMFYMIDSNLKEPAINKYIRTYLLKIPPKEEFVSIKQDIKKPVYKCVVSDIINATDNAPLTEFTCYSIDHKLEPGKKYLITYKLVPHPQDGQKLMMVVNDVEDTDDFLSNFTMTEDRKESLIKFQVKEDETIKSKFLDTVQKVKGILNADYNDLLITIIDLWFHSVLEFNIGSLTNIRGYLDTLIVGESRIGKTSTVEALQKVYQVGKIISLAGNSVTVAGLIGGSNKVGGSYQTRAGIIPQHHKGGLVFEEFSKARDGMIKELTDVRSSGKVRIVRVNGSIELPALVRMLTLSNAKAINGVTKPISSYPNGIPLLLDLIGNAEDIARYDLISIFGFNADKPIDPFFEPPIPYEDIDYQTRIRWIWSRKPNQVIISKEMYGYVVKQANELNKKYDSYIKIFGIEAWKKIIRLAIAIAGYVCSTDETFENIVIKREHIDLASELFVSLYDNETFRFKQFVDEERKLRDIDTEGIQVLQNLYEKNPTLLNFLANSSETTRTNLSMVSGIDNDEFSKLIHIMVQNLFVRVNNFTITPTERFRKGMTKINTDIKVARIGEVTLKIEKTNVEN